MDYDAGVLLMVYSKVRRSRARYTLKKRRDAIAPTLSNGKRLVNVHEPDVSRQRLQRR
jgi:hypothetical protein